MQGDPYRKRCQHCPATILMAQTPQGRWIPLDPDPDPRGNLILKRGLDRTTRAVDARQGYDDDDRYISHFATCPGASRARRSR